MAWKTHKTYTYKDAAGTTVSGDFKVQVQYDTASMTPEAVDVRFKIDGTVLTTDGFYILYNANNYPESIGRKVYKIKGPSSLTWDTASDSFTVKKDYDDADFTIQDFWICNIGKGTVSGQNVTYSSGTKTFYDWFKEGGARESYCCQITSTQLDGTVATNIGKGTISITDNYNNTFTVKGTKGADGENNLVSSFIVSWGYSTAYESSGNVTNKALTIKTPADASRTIYAKTVTTSLFGPNTTVTTSKAIRQYVAPSAPGVPLLAYTKSRLTVKEPWTFTWTAAKATNSSSPVVGYRIRLYKNNTIINGLGTGSGNSIVPVAGATNAWLDRDSTSTTVKIDPTVFGFKAGDTVKLGIYAYTRYGTSNTGSQLFNSASVQTISTNYLVQNAGITNVNVNGSWKEGQVYVNVNGFWKEAESVSVNANGTWKESQ